MSAASAASAAPEDPVLLYLGAGWDISMPIYGTTILVDGLPELSYWKTGERGHTLGAHFLAVLQHLMTTAYPGCLFTDVPGEKLWKWTHPFGRWRIYYYYGVNLEKDKLPALALEATMLWARGYWPSDKIIRSLPKLRSITGPSACLCWIKDDALLDRFNVVPRVPVDWKPVAVLSDVQLVMVRLAEEQLLAALTPPAAASTAAAAAATPPNELRGLAAAIKMLDGVCHMHLADRKTQAQRPEKNCTPKASTTKIASKRKQTAAPPPKVLKRFRAADDEAPPVTVLDDAPVLKRTLRSSK